MTPIIIFFILAFLSATGVWFIRIYAEQRQLLDHPNERSSRVTPMPRTRKGINPKRSRPHPSGMLRESRLVRLSGLCTNSPTVHRRAGQKGKQMPIADKIPVGGQRAPTREPQFSFTKCRINFQT
jgi:hypothetical protein